MIKLIAVLGPTAAGKTEYAVRIASGIGGEIVSCDSMQLYEDMDIGSAKPSKEELAAVRHHLIGVVSPKEKMTPFKYQKMAKEAISDIASRGKTPVICGGSGLYFNSLLYDMDFAASPGDTEEREKYYEIAEHEGPEALYEMLKSLDPASASRIHPNNVKRVIRALEAASSGEPIKDISTGPELNKEYDIDIIGITRDREELYRRIDKRVDVMMEMGLTDEVKKLVAMGLSSCDISMKGIGYKEMIGYLEGEYDLAEAVRLIKRNSRHYAKRQMTWFKRYPGMKWFNVSDHPDDESCFEEIMKWLKRK